MNHLDITGRRVEPGDLLRTPHFRDRRRRQHYLYHVAVQRDGRMFAVNVHELEPSYAARKMGGTCLLQYLRRFEIIAGTGPGDCICHLDRPKEKSLG